MMTASAPGKLILFGEYAVLEGAPAMVAAVDRRARVTIGPAPSGEIHVAAPNIGVSAKGRYRRGDRRVLWSGSQSVRRRLRLVTDIMVAFGIDDGSALTLDTSDFFAGQHAKFGIGSSAALTVALAGAIRASQGGAPPELAELVDAHRAVQGGRGSGVDIGAALAGAVSIYRTGQPGPSVQPAQLPDDLHWCCVFTGRSASTSAALRSLAGWRARHPGDYRRHIAALTATAEDGIRATERSDAAALLESIADYGARLDELGTAAGIDIVSADHRSLGNVADACGVIYKPSGSGGGDIGVAFSRDTDHIDAFRRAAASSGYRMIDMALAERGLTVTHDAEHQPGRQQG